MTTKRLGLLGLCALGLLQAQSFPPEFNTDDGSVSRTIRTVAEAMAGGNSSLSYEFRRLISVPANRVYRGMNNEARAAALRVALPVLKQWVMSDALQKEHDAKIARSYGAVDHGLKLPPRRDAQKLLEQMSEQMQKNPMALQKPGFLEELTKLQQEAADASTEAEFDSYLTLFTKPFDEVKRGFQEERVGAARLAELTGQSGYKKCLDEAAPLADTSPDRFRLQLFRCEMAKGGIEKSEREADRIRKERAQRLYNERSLHGLTRKCLQEFLDTAAKVDFAAQTVEKGGRQVFVNPALEKRSDLWKLVYRNGKQPTEVAMRFAKEWLTELEPPTPAPAPATVSSAAGAAGKAKPAPAKAAPRK